MSKWRKLKLKAEDDNERGGGEGEEEDEGEDWRLSNLAFTSWLLQPKHVETQQCEKSETKSSQPTPTYFAT